MREIKDCWEHIKKSPIILNDIIYFKDSFVMFCGEESQVLYRQNAHGRIDLHDDGPMLENIERNPFKDSWKAIRRKK